MIALLSVALFVGVVVLFLVPAHAGFLRHFITGMALGACGLSLAVAVAVVLGGGAGQPAEWLAMAVVTGLYGAILGATGGAVVGLGRSLPAVQGMLAPRKGLDPEGESMDAEAAAAWYRRQLDAARQRTEAELARSEFDADLWRQAGEETRVGSERQRRRYIELRAERILLG